MHTAKCDQKLRTGGNYGMVDIGNTPIEPAKSWHISMQTLNAACVDGTSLGLTDFQVFIS